MSHLNEKLAEFVFEELPPQEMAEARNHLADCSACRTEVQRFQATHVMLKASPALEPPRHLWFEFERREVSSWIWRWLAPMAASAAVALAIVNFAPRSQPQPQIVERVIQQPAAQPTTQPIDYRQLVEEIRASDRAWLADELKKRDAAEKGQIERLRAQLASLDYYQQKIERRSWDYEREVQLLAAKTEPGR